MSKEMTAADVAAWLESKGFEIPEDVAAARDNAVEDAAYTKVSEKVTRGEEEGPQEYTDRVTAIQEALFAASVLVAENVSGEKKNVGRGSKFERSLTVETHEGTLKVTLQS